MQVDSKLIEQIEKVREICERKVMSIRLAHALENSPVGLGDEVSDNRKTITIDHIRVSKYEHHHGCRYYGPVVGEPDRRDNVWQCNMWGGVSTHIVAERLRRLILTTGCPAWTYARWRSSPHWFRSYAMVKSRYENKNGGL